MSFVVKNSFNFIFKLIINKVWRRLGEICAMNAIVSVRGEKGSVENGVDSPGVGERESVIEGTKDFRNSERSFTFRG